MSKRVFGSHAESGEQCRGAVIGIGNFDGIHLGHQKLIAQVKEIARLRKMPAAIYTFDPHPMAVIAPDKAPSLISSLECKLGLLNALEIDIVVNEQFTPDYATISPADFVVEILHRSLKVACVVVGENYRFGHNANGSVADLKRLLPECGIDLVVVPGLVKDGAICSSSRIRKLVVTGEVTSATSLLGRPFSRAGTVRRGAGRGTQIGVPTINLDTESGLIPKDGVYASLVLDGKLLKLGVTNVGTRPTFERNGQRSIETHLIGEDGDFYDRFVRVFFISRIRDEKRFASVEALTKQIRGDMISAEPFAREALPSLSRWIKQVGCALNL